MLHIFNGLKIFIIAFILSLVFFHSISYLNNLSIESVDFTIFRLSSFIIGIVFGFYGFLRSIFDDVIKNVNIIKYLKYSLIYGSITSIIIFVIMIGGDFIGDFEITEFRIIRLTVCVLFFSGFLSSCCIIMDDK